MSCMWSKSSLSKQLSCPFEHPIPFFHWWTWSKYCPECNRTCHPIQLATWTWCLSSAWINLICENSVLLLDIIYWPPQFCLIDSSEQIHQEFPVYKDILVRMLFGHAPFGFKFLILKFKSLWYRKYYQKKVIQWPLCKFTGRSGYLPLSNRRLL